MVHDEWPAPRDFYLLYGDEKIFEDVMREFEKRESQKLRFDETQEDNMDIGYDIKAIVAQSCANCNCSISGTFFTAPF
ncbi:MAG: hypothetical protein J6X47_03495 [Clostridia bacterium]|nr:hypothetical protein [Clostridia bacterium]